MFIESVMPSNHLILCCPLLSLPLIFPNTSVFSSGWPLCIRGQSNGISVSVLPMNIQGWFPLGLTGLISLQSKWLSRVFSSTTIKKHQFYGAQPSLWSKSHICTWLLKKTIVLTIETFVGKLMSLFFNTLSSILTIHGKQYIILGLRTNIFQNLSRSYMITSL